ncbi:hypothetical protein K435DRAFT_875204 [Dendrothele bispora CBS 962.96]|uniref:Uncharacterized protein n=1 Tax=Dendrothele bispora (strain CBS 962.96) TaxID=1314807 RepID=A0A4S8KUT6_DENBC|nr:hypothetical protein K435DRAFT_875204 [Dendrothele bispora CBS 962.96]
MQSNGTVGNFKRTGILVQLNIWCWSWLDSIVNIILNYYQGVNPVILGWIPWKSSTATGDQTGGDHPEDADSESGNGKE